MTDEGVERVRVDLADLLDRDLYLKKVWVAGIEVTQSIQHYGAARHLTDPNDRGADNSVRLIASKPAWVRVYVRSRFGDHANVTGSLAIQRRFGGFFWTSVATFSPQSPASVTARRNPGYAAERGNRLAALNFVIPAVDFHGVMRLSARIVDDEGIELDTDEQQIDATLRQTLRVRAILVSYNGPWTANPPAGTGPAPNVRIAAPTLADLATTSALALRAMPVQSAGNFASAGTVTCTRPLDDVRSCAGCCSANWNTLLNQLTTARTNDGNRADVVYYGLLPATMPVNVPGCGQGGLGSAKVGDQGTFMHEIGHGYGFQHTPCGNGGTPDPSYPTYEPYPSASIGEYGLDINDGTIFAPNGTFDYMSYCGPQWMSLYQHNRLILHPRLGQEWLRDDLPWRRDHRKYVVQRDLPYPPPDPFIREDLQMNPVIAISGIVHGPGKIEVLNVARVAVMAEPSGERTSLSAGLIGANGEVVASASIRRLVSHGGGGCGCTDCGPDEHDDGPYSFEVYVPDVEPGISLVIDEGEQRVWERTAPAERVEVSALRADIDDCRLRLRWEVGGQPSTRRKRDKSDNVTETWVQWSPDDGATWFGLATGLSGSEADLDAGAIRSGPALVRVLVHDGFHTAISEPVAVDVPMCGALVAIQHPDDGGLYLAGSPLRLHAVAMEPSGATIDETWARWVLDGKEVAQGIDEWINAPGPGDHRLEVYVRTAGDEAESTVRFRCEPGPDSAEGRPDC
jgi:Peptidase M66